MIIQAFIIGIDPKTRCLRNFKITINSHIKRAKCISGGCIARELLANDGFFRHAVEKTACAAAPKEQGVRTAQNFNLLEII